MLSDIYFRHRLSALGELATIKSVLSHMSNDYDNKSPLPWHL